MKFDVRTDSLKKATIINAVSKYSTVVMNLLFTAILARLLTPDDYGVVAILTVFTNFFAIFSDMGIGTAVIQNRKLTKDDENKIYTFTIGLGILLAVLFTIFSQFLVIIYKNKVYSILGAILSISLAFRAFNMVPSAILMKQKRFMLSGIRLVIVNIVSFIVAVIIAMAGGKYYAIVLQSVASSLCVYLWNLFSTKLRISFGNIIRSIKKIFSFSFYQFLFSIINYFTRNLDNLLTGYYFGQAELGYYDKAYKLMRYPVENLTNVLTPSIQPILSEHQNDKEYIKNKYNQMVKLLSLVGIFIAVFCFYSSREVILIFFGSQWEKSIECFHILSLPLILQMVNGLGGSIYQSLNKTKYLFINGIISAVILVLSILIGVKLGTIESLALSYSIGFVLTFLECEFCLSYFCFNCSIWNLLEVYFPETIIFLTMMVGMYFVPSFENLLISTFVKFIICGMIYLIMLILTKEYKVFISMLPQKLAKRFEKRSGMKMK